MATFNNQINISDIPKIQDLEYHPLENRYKAALYVYFVVSTLLLGSILAALLLIKQIRLPELALWIAGVVFTIRTITSFLKIAFGFKFKQYAVREKDVIYNSGWLWRSSTTAPFNRVQHIRIDQGPIERRFNLSRLKIFTAGGSSSDLTIPGLDPTNANKLKQFIVSKTSMDEEE
ncbi:MAG: PH domain-containing protein [Saprospiraceae bacterium]|nr:PH domain-containing protein [Bacteroidia bacterium]NNE13450.1 PH domain-containing protein [Saprospiraceae bacterium]NNL93819.1 PH domain-containing protein [Saprospiraceae bacterium]